MRDFYTETLNKTSIEQIQHELGVGKSLVLRQGVL